MNYKIILYIINIFLVLLSSCTNIFFQQFGHVSPDAQNIRQDGKDVYIPANAPSISQGYWPNNFDIDHHIQIGDHEGVDIIAKEGTPIIAAASGVVIGSFYGPLFGNRVLIDHGINNSGRFVISRYVHLEKRLVAKGETVKRGQQIGTLGDTGILAGGIPHLHFEIRSGSQPEISKSKPHNPHKFWVEGIGNITCYSIHKQWSDSPFKTTYPVPCKSTEWRDSP